jgi:hypothetical protein
LWKTKNADDPCLNAERWRTLQKGKTMTRKTWKIALGFGLPWAVIMLIFNLRSGVSPTIDIIVTTITGIIGGFGFALTMKYVAKWLYKKTMIDMLPNERLIMEAGANHFKGKEAVGGKLALTD